MERSIREREVRSREGDLVGARASASARSRGASFSYDTLADAFPIADPGLIPFGSNVLVQLRTPRKKSAGGIVLPEESRETEQWNTQVAKIHSLGPVAFCNRETLKQWPEGAWSKPGEYVRCPKYGGDRWWVATEAEDEKALFVLFNDLDLGGRVPEEKVLQMVAYIT